MTPLVFVEQPAPHVVQLALNRPDQLNAMNAELCEAMHEQLRALTLDRSCRVVILTGAGRGFCAGVDLRGYGAAPANNESDLPRDRLDNQEHMSKLVLGLRALPQPVIAAVNGPAAGAGMNLALACDIRLAVDGAVFGQNFAKVGLFPDYGGTYFLPQLVGPSVAAEMFYLGEMIDAQSAHRLGIINHLFPADKFEAAIAAFAKKIADGPQLAIRAVKQNIFSREKEALREALEREVQAQLKCFHSHDCLEGIRAFMEKRAPKFQGS